MAGKRGQSKGCGTCRRRKKGCDSARPACGQCRAAALHCEGYQRNPKWVQVTPQVESHASLTVRKKSAPDVTFPATLAQSARYELYVGEFWSSYLPDGQAFPTGSSQYINGAWMNQLHGLPRHSHRAALDRSLLALALTKIGQRDKEPWMIESGLRFYGESLAALAAQLEKQNQVMDDVSIMTAKLLSLYEILYRLDLQGRVEQIRNWRLHQTGQLGFLQARGPRSFASGLAHLLFVDGRSTLISSSIATGTPSMLASHEWKTIPWETIPKTPKDLLGDIFADVPGLLASLHALRHGVQTEGAEPHGAKRNTLLAEARVLEAEWLHWGEVSAPHIANAPRFIDSFIEAHLMSTYWAIGVIIHGTIDLAQGTKRASTLLTTSLAPDDPRSSIKRLIELIPAFLNPRAGQFGVHGPIFSSIVAVHYLKEMGHGFETEAYYHALGTQGNGTLIRYYVDNMLQALAAQGMRFFEQIEV